MIILGLTGSIYLQKIRFPGQCPNRDDLKRIVCLVNMALSDIYTILNNKWDRNFLKIEEGAFWGAITESDHFVTLGILNEGPVYRQGEIEGLPNTTVPERVYKKFLDNQRSAYFIKEASGVRVR